MTQTRNSLRSILNSLNEGVMEITYDGGCTFINKTALDLLGYTSHEVLGRNTHDLFHYKFPDGTPMSSNECKIYKAYMKGKSTRLLEETLWHKDGSPIECLISCSPLFEKGKLAGGVVTIIDNRERKKNEEELQKYRERLELAQKAGEIGVYEWNLRTDRLWFSEQEAKLMGDPTQQIVAPSEWVSTIHPADRERVEKEIKVAIAKKSDYESEFRIIHPNGNILWLKSKGQLIRDKKGKPIRLIGINYDITQRILSEELLQFKTEASRALTSSLNYKHTLQQVAQLAINHIADWCVVDLLEDGEMKMLAVAHKDPAKVKWAREFREKNPIDLNARTGSAEVMRTGKPQFIPHITKEMIRATIKDEKMLKLVESLGFTSVIVVPLITDGKPIGTISLVSTESKWHYDATALEMSLQLASRASLAIENAKLYHAVKAERKRLTELVENVPGVVWEAWVEPDGETQKIDFVSDYVEKMLGYSIDEWLTTPNFWLKVVHPEDREKAAAVSRELYDEDSVGVNRFRWIAKNGKVIWVESHSYVIRDRDGKPIGMRGVVMDISERMEIERRKDEFITMASHELKTPITSIKVFTQILHKYFDKKGETEAVSHLTKMENQIDKLTALVGDLLDVSKIQAGRLELRPEKFAICDLVSEVAEAIQSTSDRHKIILRRNYQGVVYADRDRVGQVVINLLTNAIKYSPEKDKVVVTISKNNGMAQISVRDYGVGIEKEHFYKIFDRFYRVFDNRDKTFPGLGMGLYISSQIIKRHHGKMWVKSKAGEGSTFYFTLPLSARLLTK